MIKLTEHTDDKVLWQAVKVGDKDGFNLLFQKYYSPLFFYGIKIVSHSDFIKECVQEVFIRIWETRLNLAKVENVKSYLFVSLRRMILTQHEKMKKEKSIELKETEDYFFLFELNEFESHEEITDDIRELLLNGINSLTRKQRELVMLFFYHELSYSEISQVIGISVQAVRNLMYRTLIHLRKTLGEKSIDSMKNMFFTLFSTFLKK